MAAVLAILRALRRVVRQDLGSLESIKLNNLFLFVLLLVYGAVNSGQRPRSAEPLFVLFGFLLLFPLSSDPLGRIPRDRLAVWPLTHRQRLALRLSSLGLSPVLWIAAAMLLVTASVRVALSFLALAAAIQAASVLGRQLAHRDPHWDLLLYIPRFPGRLGGLVRKDVREMLSLLDPYAAVFFSAGGGIYRFFSTNPDPAAFSILAILVALSLSTYAQSLFGLDLDSGMTRYRLMPLRGWEILLAKDLGFLAILAVLLLPLDVAPGLTFGLAALALGHHSSVFLELPQRRWRFTSGRLLPVGAVQAAGGVALGFAERQYGPLVLGLTAAAYAGSVYFYGRQWERVR